MSSFCKQKNEMEKGFFAGIFIVFPAKNMSRQSWAKKSGFTKLVAGKRALGLLLECLKTTEVWVSDGARDREIEWEQQNNYAGEDLLNN